MGGRSGNQMVINPRSGTGSIDLGFFPALILGAVMHPEVAAIVLFVVVIAVLIARYIHKHITWK
jgi:hypothetical protein